MVLLSIVAVCDYFSLNCIHLKQNGKPQVLIASAALQVFLHVHAWGVAATLDVSDVEHVHQCRVFS